MVLFTEAESIQYIKGDSGKIEMMAAAGKGENLQSMTAVVCHPHPQHGGTMNNKVVTTLVRVYRELGVNVIRFNFRGVGNSEGAYGETHGELSDLLTVITWLKLQRPADKVLLAGFSFGSYISWCAASQLDSIKHLVLVAPPVEKYPFNVARPDCPVCVVQGDVDDVVRVSGVHCWWRDQHLSGVVIDIAGADHFFHGKLTDLKRELVPEIAKQMALFKNDASQTLDFNHCENNKGC